MIEVHISTTTKGFHPASEFIGGHDETRRFPDMDTAKAWLKERYGRSKRAPMYRDQKDGPPIKIGYVIGFRASDNTPTGMQHWIQQDWVSFRECNEVRL